MCLCFAGNVDFFPDVRVGDNSLQVVSESKILGIIIQDSLKWNRHVQHICERARKKLFIIVNMMELKLDYNTIIDVYLKEIRSVLEYGSVVFHSGLTKKLADEIEDIQRIFCRLLAGYLKLSLSYSESCILFKIDFLFS